MTNRLGLIAVAAAIALFGAYQFANGSNAGEEREFARDKCIENCG